jgi:hypothetical protein
MNHALLLLSILLSPALASATPCLDFGGSYSGYGIQTDSKGNIQKVVLHQKVTQTGCETMAIDEDWGDYISGRTYITDGKVHVRETRIAGQVVAYHHAAAQFRDNGLDLHLIENYVGDKTLTTLAERWDLDSQGVLHIEIFRLDGRNGMLKKVFQLKRD